MMTKGVVSAGDPLTSEAGVEILRAGGNAFDAAIAATFMSFVASASITSAGGGGFFLASPGRGKKVMYDFFVQTPLKKRKESELDFYPITVDFGDKTQEFHIGMGAAATPGNVAGLFKVHEVHGSIPMSEIAAPAIEVARKGVVLHKQTAYQVKILAPILSFSKEGKKIYSREDRMISEGERYRMPHFADTLEYLANHGPREFYEGEIAARMAEASLERGGHLDMDDLKNYRVELRNPLTTQYRDYQVFTNPPPNSGGPLIAFMLRLLESVPMRRGDYGTRKHLQWLYEAIRLTADVRKIRLMGAEPPGALRALLADWEYLESLQQTLQQSMHKSGNTTHVSVVDEHHNIATVTTSVGEGCGFIIPGTDIMLNNMLGEEDLNNHGFHQWIPNQRISSMMAPTIVALHGRPVMGLGSGGSNRIRSALVQAITNFIDFNLDYDEIVNNPRIHWENDHLDVEPGFDEETIHAIRLPENNHVFLWSEKNMYFGGVHAVFIDGKGHLHGAGDRRRAGNVSHVK